MSKTIIGKYGNIIIRTARQSTEQSRDEFMKFIVKLAIKQVKDS